MPKKKEHQVFDNVEMKHCPDCNQWKPLNEFNKCKKTWDKLHSTCKICHRKHSSQYRKDNPEKHNEGNRRYRANNLEKIQEYNRNYMNNKYANDLEFRQKVKIRALTKAAIASGKLIKPEACTLCHEIGPIQAHHFNYTEYDILNPMFVCANCHAEIHKLDKLSNNEDPNDV